MAAQFPPSDSSAGLAEKPERSNDGTLDEIKNKFNVPVAASQVSGEYSMIKAACEKGFLDYDQTILETTMAFKRAGADIIASYFAKDILKLIS